MTHVGESDTTLNAAQKSSRVKCDEMSFDLFARSETSMIMEIEKNALPPRAAPARSIFAILLVINWKFALRRARD